jgi:hypothetical protein
MEERGCTRHADGSVSVVYAGEPGEPLDSIMGKVPHSRTFPWPVSGTFTLDSTVSSEQVYFTENVIAVRARYKPEEKA